MGRIHELLIALLSSMLSVCAAATSITRKNGLPVHVASDIRVSNGTINSWSVATNGDINAAATSIARKQHFPVYVASDIKSSNGTIASRSVASNGVTNAAVTGITPKQRFPVHVASAIKVSNSTTDSWSVAINGGTNAAATGVTRKRRLPVHVASAIKVSDGSAPSQRSYGNASRDAINATREQRITNIARRRSRASIQSQEAWKKQGMLECEDSLAAPFWGIWIDGRSATGGPNAYGMPYSRSMQDSLAHVYRIARKHETTLQVKVFMDIKRFLGGEWSSRVQLLEDPITIKLIECFRKHTPASSLASVMRGITLFDLNLRDTMRFNLSDKQSTIQRIFDIYNHDVASASSFDEQLFAVAWLMQNMAFLHPFDDFNGRSRLLLLQYELRRLGIACGTMNYNNNHNVYVDDVDTFTAKLKEGIEIYNEAVRSGSNPWSANFSNLDRIHRSQFHREYTAAQQHCNVQICGPQSLIDGICRGTSVE